MTRSWLRPCSVKEMTLTEAAWLAGFFDGEGSLSNFMGGKDQKYPSWVISIPNTHKASLERCKSYTGVGYITPKPIRSNRKPQWQWRVNCQRDIEAICRQMLPYTVTKKQTIENFLTVWSDI